MMDKLSTKERLLHELESQGICHTHVLRALANTPREQFLQASQRDFAYQNAPLSIGYGQTISQPYVVAKMTELLLNYCPQPWRTVLEVGTGSGYQAAVLAQIFEKVYSIETIAELQQNAVKRFKQLALNNIDCKVGDGKLGWPRHAPFDAIIITAATEMIPTALLEQLADNGTLIAPVGSRQQQYLKVLQKHDQTISEFFFDPVIFVPLV